jgi:pSer/pThr/pTyr-binding forkhead associated (FHA) protein
MIVLRGRPQGKALIFPRGEYVFGRGQECHIRPNSSWVSRQHCLLHVAEASASLRDLGSTNGTLVNGKRIVGERLLADGDEVQVGPLVFQIHLEVDAPVAEPPVQVETGTHCLETAEAKKLTDPADLSPTTTPAPANR